VVVPLGYFLPTSGHFDELDHMSTTLDWIMLVLLIFSAIVLFDALRRIIVALRHKENLLMNEYNMAIHFLSYFFYLVGVLSVTITEQIPKYGIDNQIVLWKTGLAQMVLQGGSSLILYFILFKFSSNTENYKVGRMTVEDGVAELTVKNRRTFNSALDVTAEDEILRKDLMTRDPLNTSFTSNNRETIRDRPNTRCVEQMDFSIMYSFIKNIDRGTTDRRQSSGSL
jgi:hypothetical protein